MLNNELLERAGTALPCDPPQRNRWPYQVRRLRWLTHSGASGVAIWNRYDRVPMLNCELEDELVGTALPCGPPQRNRWPDPLRRLRWWTHTPARPAWHVRNASLAAILISLEGQKGEEVDVLLRCCLLGFFCTLHAFVCCAFSALILLFEIPGPGVLSPE